MGRRLLQGQSETEVDSMCLAVPAKIVEIKDSLAMVEVRGVKRQASLMLLPEAKVGDYVLVHAGFAMQVIDRKLAEETEGLWREMAGGERTITL